MTDVALVKLHPEFILKNGRKTSVLLPYKEFKALQEKLQDIEDLELLDEAKAKEGHKKKDAIRPSQKRSGPLVRSSFTASQARVRASFRRPTSDLRP
jgi:hypothetical protein